MTKRAEGVDPADLDAACQVIRLEKEQEAVCNFKLDMENNTILRGCAKARRMWPLCWAKLNSGGLFGGNFGSNGRVKR